MVTFLRRHASGISSACLVLLGFTILCFDQAIIPEAQAQYGPYCNGVSYNPATQGCCNGTIYTTATEGCCPSGSTYTLATQACCNGMMPYTTATQGCCGTTVYSLSGYACCITTDGSTPITYTVYNTSTQFCCACGCVYDNE